MSVIKVVGRSNEINHIPEEGLYLDKDGDLLLVGRAAYSRITSTGYSNAVAGVLERDLCYFPLRAVRIKSIEVEEII